MFDFPNSPTLNQVFGAYTWDGQKWAQTPGLIAATALPLMDGTPAAVGSGNRYAREDHIHPVDIAAVRADIVQTLTTAQQQQARQNIGSPAANVIINGDFRVNQIGYVSAAVLSAGTYGHDQWKAGASGGDYSFTQLKSSTQITIASGKSLIQPIEDVNVVGGSYVLSWTGTAQARAGVNTLTPSGAYAVSPLLITGQTAGTVMSVEFNSGTLGTVKLESGAIATPFIMRPYDQELSICKRYLQSVYAAIEGVPAAGYTMAFGGIFVPEMRGAPTLVGTPDANANTTALTYPFTTNKKFAVQTTAVTSARTYWYGLISSDARL